MSPRSGFIRPPSFPFLALSGPVYSASLAAHCVAADSVCQSEKRNDAYEDAQVDEVVAESEGRELCQEGGEPLKFEEGVDVVIVIGVIVVGGLHDVGVYKGCLECGICR